MASNPPLLDVQCPKCNAMNEPEATLCVECHLELLPTDDPEQPFDTWCCAECNFTNASKQSTEFLRLMTGGMLIT